MDQYSAIVFYCHFLCSKKYVLFLYWDFMVWKKNWLNGVKMKKKRLNKTFINKYIWGKVLVIYSYFDVANILFISKKQIVIVEKICIITFCSMNETPFFCRHSRKHICIQIQFLNYFIKSLQNLWKIFIFHILKSIIVNYWTDNNYDTRM